MSAIFYVNLGVIAILGAFLVFLMGKTDKLRKGGANPQELRLPKCLVWVTAIGLLIGLASIILLAVGMTAEQNQSICLIALVLFIISAMALVATVLGLVKLSFR